MSRQDRESTIVNRDSLEADVASAKAALELAQIDLQNHRLLAPTGGQLGQISVRLGACVSAGTHLTSLVPPAALGDCQPQRDPSWPKSRWLAGRSPLTVDALNGETFHGKVRVSPRRPGWSSAPSLRLMPPRQFPVKIAQRIPVRITVNDGQKQQRTPAAGDVRCRPAIDTRAEKQP